jgi:hypothetical protein
MESNCTEALVCFLFETLKQSRWGLWNIPAYSDSDKFVNGYDKHSIQKVPGQESESLQNGKEKS